MPHPRTGPDLHLSPALSPRLAERTGHDRVTTSGRTLPGARGKAGIVIIRAAARLMRAVARRAVPG